MFLAVTSNVMAVQLKSMQLNILILQTVVDDREKYVCFTFVSHSAMQSSSSASEHQLVDLFYVTNFSIA